MFRIGTFTWCIFFLSWGILTPVFGEVRFTVEKEAPVFHGTPTLYVDAKASTWKPRGRLLYDIEGSVRVKLTAAGFDIVRTRSSPHAFTLSVDYQETRGIPLGVNDFGTVITGKFRLEDRQGDSLFELVLQETADSSNSGTPPYLDTLQNFQTNPYYYFLGNIVWGQVHGKRNVQTIFLEALEALARNHKRTDDSGQTLSRFSEPAHSLVSSHALFAATAIQRTIHEFLTSNNRQIIPVLFLLLDYPHANVRVSAINALGAFRELKSQLLLEELQRHDLDIGVRKAAQTVIQDFEASQ